MMQVSKRIAAAVLLSTGCAWSAVAQEPAPAASCKTIHADMTELRSTVGCKPEHATCFLGEVTGNHGLLGTTYFKSDAGAAGPSTSPGFISYSGVFEYITPSGTFVTRETGVVNQTQGQADSGVVTAYQAITSATGELAGATGYFFVSGFSRDGRVVTKVTGQVCKG